MRMLVISHSLTNMKAKLYSLEVCESALSQIHGFGSIIKEIYIPDLDTSINIHSGNVHIFETKDPTRYTFKNTNAVLLKEIELLPSVVGLVLRYREIKKEVNEFIPAFFKLLEQESQHEKQKTNIIQN